MNSYEILYILKASLDEAAREAEIEKISAGVKENGGEVENVNKWGMKRFAYPIDFKTEGFYVLMTFKSPPGFPAELERRLRIADGVVRFMLTTA
jgi:small subunit ribosomal protein S6